jgi:hypothetical protein
LLSEPRRREFLRSYPAIDDEDSRAAILRAAIPFLDGLLRPEWSAELIEAARSLRSTSLRAEMLVALLPHRSGPDREALLAEVLDAVRRVPDLRERIVLVRQLAGHSDGTEWDAASAGLLEAVHEAGPGDGPERGIESMEVLAALGPRLDRGSLRAALFEALGEVRTGLGWPGKDRRFRTADALTALAPCLGGPGLDDVRREALTLARSLDCGMPGVSAVISLLLAPEGAERPEPLGEALEVARRVDNKRCRVLALVRVAETVGGEARRTIAREALTVARDISEVERSSRFFNFRFDERVDALTAVIPVLDGPERDELARELFKGARVMTDDRQRTLAFKKLLRTWARTSAATFSGSPGGWPSSPTTEWSASRP